MAKASGLIGPWVRPRPRPRTHRPSSALTDAARTGHRTSAPACFSNGSVRFLRRFADLIRLSTAALRIARLNRRSPR
jgi:hypothetical protein